MIHNKIKIIIRSTDITQTISFIFYIEYYTISITKRVYIKLIK